MVVNGSISPMFTMSQKNISIVCQIRRTSRLPERFDCQPAQILNGAAIDAGSDVTFIFTKALGGARNLHINFCDAWPKLNKLVRRVVAYESESRYK